LQEIFDAIYPESSSHPRTIGLRVIVAEIQKPADPVGEIENILLVNEIAVSQKGLEIG
jgi:hypothetical protein